MEKQWTARAKNGMELRGRGIAWGSVEKRCEGIAWKSNGQRRQGEVVNALQS